MDSFHPLASEYRVSVIIPTHNRLSRLPVAVDSVLEQTYSAHELIVVDDGSTDGTAQWLARERPSVTVIRQDNKGVSHARNRGIEAASGNWIALLDSDDRWYAHKLATQINALRNQPGHRLCHSDEHWLRNGKRVNPKYKHQKYGGSIFAHCLPLCAISPSAALIEKSLIEDIGLFDESLPACEDYDLWLRISARENVLFVDEALLEKTGGHDDQLSQRFPAMDRFRLQALAKLIRSGILSPSQLTLALSTFSDKLTIFINGAKKRGKHDSARQLLEQFDDVVLKINQTI